MLQSAGTKAKTIFRNKTDYYSVYREQENLLPKAESHSASEGNTLPVTSDPKKSNEPFEVKANSML